MKKIFNYLILAIILIPINIFAASGKINVTSTSMVIVGNTVTTTVTISSAEKIGSWEMNLEYDRNYLSLVSTTSESGGTGMASVSSKGVTSYKYTFRFKALKSGTTKISVPSYLAYAFDDFEEINLSSSSKSLTIKTKEQVEASYSKDNFLKSLKVEGFVLTENFSKDKTEYTVEVPEDTKTVNIQAEKNHYKASVSGTGVKDVSLGLNIFEVSVRAENGSEKTYKINVNVIDKNPINVKVEDNNYTIVKIKESLEKPLTFYEDTVTINDIEIPAFKNKALNYTLVGLKDQTGTINLYIYNEKENSYTLYNEMKFNNLNIIIKDYKTKLKNYNSYKININGQETEVLKIHKESRFSIIYGTNTATGETSLYKYDEKDKTLIVYDDELNTILYEKINVFTYIILGFTILLTLTIIIIIVMMKKKKQKTKQPAK